MDGWISLHRKLKDWEWYTEPNTFRLFIHCLLCANHKGNKWRGVEVERGSFITSIDNLSKELHLSVQQIRTSLKKLKSTNEITIKTTNKFTCIVLNNWELYQNEEKSNNQTNKPINKPITNKQQTNNKQITTNNNDNNDNNDNNNIEVYKSEFKNSLQPFLETYGKDMLNSFYSYWTEKNPRGRKMRFQKEKVFDVKRRLLTWSKNDFNNKNKKAENNEQLKQITTIAREQYPNL